MNVVTCKAGWWPFPTCYIRLFVLPAAQVASLVSQTGHLGAIAWHQLGLNGKMPH